MMKELGSLLAKTSIFFSDTILNSGDYLLFVSWFYVCTLIIYLIVQTMVALDNISEFSKYSLIVIPVLLIAQFSIITLMCIICLQICYFAIIPFIIYIIASCAISGDTNEHSLYGITTTVCTFFNKLGERDSTLKGYKTDYKNAIKKSEDLWKQHKLS